MSKKIQEFMDKITEDFANENFYPICGTAYGIHVMLFLIGFAFKKNFLILELLSMLAGFISIMLLCPKLDEGKQKVCFAFLRTFPIFMISVLVSTPILKASKKIVEMGGTGKLSILAFMAVFLTIACFVAFYFSDKGGNCGIGEGIFEKRSGSRQRRGEAAWRCAAVHRKREWETRNLAV